MTVMRENTDIILSHVMIDILVMKREGSASTALIVAHSFSPSIGARVEKRSAREGESCTIIVGETNGIE